MGVAFLKQLKESFAGKPKAETNTPPSMPSVPGAVSAPRTPQQAQPRETIPQRSKPSEQLKQAAAQVGVAFLDQMKKGLTNPPKVNKKYIAIGCAAWFALMAAFVVLNKVVGPIEPPTSGRTDFVFLKNLADIPPPVAEAISAGAEVYRYFTRDVPDGIPRAFNYLVILDGKVYDNSASYLPEYSKAA